MQREANYCLPQPNQQLWFFSERHETPQFVK